MEQKLLFPLQQIIFDPIATTALPSLSTPVLDYLLKDILSFGCQIIRQIGDIKLEVVPGNAKANGLARIPMLR